MPKPVSSSPLADPWPKGEWRADLRRRLLAWYRRNARDLPWRQSRDPYRIWVSEVMLQQTQVATVVPYFNRFIKKYPTIRALAAADEDQMLRLWEGMGYYRRASQLHRAAKILMAEYGGQFPSDPDMIRLLPGVGRYTAGAILSIAFDAREPILEANTVRLLSRLLAFRGDPRSSAGQRLLWEAARGLLPERGSGQLNQALMELGSQVCIPQKPNCPRCPLTSLCPTRQRGLQDKIPAAARKQQIESVREAAVIVRRRGRVLLVRRGPRERWAGLWDFPRIPCDLYEESPTPAELSAKVLAQTGVKIGRVKPLTTLQYSVTRFRITLECFEAESEAAAQDDPRPTVEMRWVRPGELGEFPLSSTGRKLAHLAGGE